MCPIFRKINEINGNESDLFKFNFHNNSFLIVCIRISNKLSNFSAANIDFHFQRPMQPSKSPPPPSLCHKEIQYEWKNQHKDTNIYIIFNFDGRIGNHFFFSFYLFHNIKMVHEPLKWPNLIWNSTLSLKLFTLYLSAVLLSLCGLGSMTWTSICWRISTKVTLLLINIHIWIQDTTSTQYQSSALMLTVKFAVKMK